MRSFVESGCSEKVKHMEAVSYIYGTRITKRSIVLNWNKTYFGVSSSSCGEMYLILSILICLDFVALDFFAAGGSVVEEFADGLHQSSIKY